MMAALRVFRQVGEVADSDFLAMEVLPILWNMSLGPLLDLQQFQAFMTLIKTMGGKIEREHTRKLRDMTSSNGAMGVGRTHASGGNATSASGSSHGLSNGEEADFETLVSGRKQANNNDLMNDWGAPAAAPANLRGSSSSKLNDGPTFSWQSSSSATRTPQSSMSSIRQQSTQRSITPDLAALTALTPKSQFSQPLQPAAPTSSSVTTTMPIRPAQPSNTPSVDWSAAARSPAAWSTQQPNINGIGGAPRSTGSFSIPPPPTSPPGVGQSSYNFPSLQPPAASPAQQPSGMSGPGKSGLDKYESLL